jgi:hypothetical protein
LFYPKENSRREKKTDGARTEIYIGKNKVAERTETILPAGRNIHEIAHNRLIMFIIIILHYI